MMLCKRMQGTWLKSSIANMASQCSALCFTKSPTLKLIITAIQLNSNSWQTIGCDLAVIASFFDSHGEFPAGNKSVKLAQKLAVFYRLFARIPSCQPDKRVSGEARFHTPNICENPLVGHYATPRRRAIPSAIASYCAATVGFPAARIFFALSRHAATFRSADSRIVVALSLSETTLPRLPEDSNSLAVVSRLHSAVILERPKRLAGIERKIETVGL